MREEDATDLGMEAFHSLLENAKARQQVESLLGKIHTLEELVDVTIIHIRYLDYGIGRLARFLGAQEKRKKSQRKPRR